MGNYKIDKPFFSVVIPVYNREDFIVDTLESVLNQEYTSFEIVVIDDGSTDNTADLIQARYGDNPQLKYHHQKNQERGVARNNGIKKAIGEFVVLFDSDDIMLSNHLSTLIQYIERYPNLNFFSTSFDVVKPNGSLVYECMLGDKNRIVDYQDLLIGNFIGCLVCFRRSLVDLVYFLEDNRNAIMEDWVFLMANLRKHQSLHIGVKTIKVLDHVGRSMAQNEIMVHNRISAMRWILENIPLESKEMNVVKGNSYMFCAIHCYLDNKRGNALRYIFCSMISNGLNLEFIPMVFKIIISRNKIQWLKIFFISYFQKKPIEKNWYD